MAHAEPPPLQGELLDLAANSLFLILLRKRMPQRCFKKVHRCHTPVQWSLCSQSKVLLQDGSMGNAKQLIDQRSPRLSCQLCAYTRDTGPCLACRVLVHRQRACCCLGRRALARRSSARLLLQTSGAAKPLQQSRPQFSTCHVHVPNHICMPEVQT